MNKGTVRLETLIMRKQGKTFDLRLGDQQAIEGVSV